MQLPFSKSFFIKSTKRISNRTIKEPESLRGIGTGIVTVNQIITIKIYTIDFQPYCLSTLAFAQLWHCCLVPVHYQLT